MRKLAFHYALNQFYPKYLLMDPSWLGKVTTDAHILAYINIECVDDRYSKLKI
jgi:hypothetical protein